MRLDLTSLTSVRPADSLRLAKLESIAAVVIVGSTCVGKTTLVETVRRSELVRDGVVEVPLRYITRPPREGDCPRENVHVSADEFEARVRAGTIALSWERAMEGGRRVRYGFARTARGLLPVYSANNAFYAPASALHPSRALESALLVGVLAPDHVRAERLLRRSPDLCAARPDEARHRLSEEAATVLPHVHLAIENHDDLESVAPAELVRLLAMIVA